MGVYFCCVYTIYRDRENNGGFSASAQLLQLLLICIYRIYTTKVYTHSKKKYFWSGCILYFFLEWAYTFVVYILYIQINKSWSCTDVEKPPLVSLSHPHSYTSKYLFFVLLKNTWFKKSTYSKIIYMCVSIFIYI